MVSVQQACSRLHHLTGTALPVAITLATLISAAALAILLSPLTLAPAASIATAVLGGVGIIVVIAAITILSIRIIRISSYKPVVLNPESNKLRRIVSQIAEGHPLKNFLREVIGAAGQRDQIDYMQLQRDFQRLYERQNDFLHEEGNLHNFLKSNNVSKIFFDVL